MLKNDEAYNEQNTIYQSHNCWSNLPIEILSKIFNHLLCMPLGARYLSRCTQVCTNWSNVATQPISWQGNVDLSFMYCNKFATDDLLERLCSTRLNEVKGIDLSGCTLLTKSGIDSIANHCRKLEHFRLSSVNIDDTGFLSLFDWVGLKHLDLSQNFNVTSDIFCGICKHCNTSLEVLNLSSTSIRSISFIFLQKSCPNLKELYLDNLEFDYNMNDMLNDETFTNVAFPKLRILSLAKSTTDFSSHSDFLLDSLLRTARELTTLDLNGNRRISHAALSFPSIRVERLFLSRTNITLKTIEIICEQWSDTLIEIDLSWSVLPNFDGIIFVMMCATDQSCKKLRFINLSGSLITDSAVGLILTKCRELEWLDLTLCHKVKSRCRRSHDGYESIQSLMKHYNIPPTLHPSS